MENYHVLECIGEGSFGKVYKGRRKYSGQVVALKFIPKTGRSDKDLRNLRREIEIMRQLQHPNIIEMIDSFETDKEVVAVTDYAEGELFQILEDDGNLPEEQVQSIACQLVSALYYLHSHRILHRDMKPQNILLGKGGVVKLCDFGFARAMSMNTLVLTSIKGTPLYMSPELVEEKPYDHTADLWALGCILYELFTGQPPFYTNSIFQLVNMIIKDPVRWPKNMTPEFKDFLQGLLTKTPRQRLSWPSLLEHPFVKHGIHVSEKDKSLPSPFTKAPTASLIMEKEKQVREKATPAGTSRILNKALEKAEQTKQKKVRAEAWATEQYKHQLAQRDSTQQKDQPPRGSQSAAASHQQVAPPVMDRPPTGEWDKAQVAEPTPRPDRISRDYSTEYPDIEVGSRKVISQFPEKKKKNIENVKLHEEDADSDDEWQTLIEATDSDHNPPNHILAIMADSAFRNKLTTGLNKASTQVLDATLEGAAKLRYILRVIMNLVTCKCEQTTLLKFLQEINCPNHILALVDHILHKVKVKEQAWCQQIVTDLVATVHAYFASDIISSDSQNEQCTLAYLDACRRFLDLAPRLIGLKIDKDLRIREQSVMCCMFLCELTEKLDGTLPDQFYELLSNQAAILESLLRGCLLDEQTLKRLEEVSQGEGDWAQQRMEDLICLCVACLAAMVHLPTGGGACVNGKRKVASCLGDLVTQSSLDTVVEDYLLLLRHPSTCSNILKVVYSVIQRSPGFARKLSNSQRDMDTLLGILQGKVDVADMECNTVIEITIHILTSLIVQTKHIPPDIVTAAPALVAFFLESQLASHTAAAALLFSQLMFHGAAVDVQNEEVLTAAMSEFTDLAQICVRPPFEYGVLDGVVLLLTQILAQGDVPMAGLYIECGLWNLLWHRLAQTLQVTSSDTDIQDIEMTDTPAHAYSDPDWGLLSFQGLLGALTMAVAVFTKETFQVISSLASPDGIITQTLMHLLSKEFLQCVDSSVESGDGERPVVEVLLQVSQLCCFPFAVDTNDELLTNIQIAMAQCGLLPRLLYAIVTFLKPDSLELPLGLVSRLVLGEPMFVNQFATAVHQLKAVPFLCSCVSTSASSMSVVCDAISICSHLVRTSPQHVTFITDVFKGPKGDYAPMQSALSHESPVVRSRTCSLLGNLMKHSNQFYPTIREKDVLLTGLIRSLRDDDPNVRKGASYALGNAAFHSGELYGKLKPSVPPLVALLDDPVAKTRANAAGALGNLSIHSTDLVNTLIQGKALKSVLETACRDNQYGVQECALTALRSMANQSTLRQELRRMNAVQKLVHISETSGTGLSNSGKMTPRARRSLALSKSSGRHSITTVMSHCTKLIRSLNDSPTPR